ncbi:5'-methylthioadenosine/S-adenosylhomocysteine nucleosidase [Lentisphaerota bacterium ZTH]|nr:5'-methylthioadenosine/S-adenosylhomocysteine nucleosidase [Lentisphaerota bacterium]WET07609.1 5'-methylthioadenosine/S-adenosylhomocysteine nucleosidase [Lentisphaerota bacterium ZTH]
MQKIISKLMVATAILFTLFMTAHSAVASKPQTAPIGIISAIKMETNYLKSQLKDMKTWTMLGRTYYTGKLNGRSVVVAQVGIGAINASVGTAILIDEFSPSAVIMTGVAGGTSKTQPGEIVIAKKVTFYDFGMLDPKGKFHRSSSYTPNSDFSGSNVKKNPLFFAADENLLKCAVKAAQNSNFSNLKYGETVYLTNAVQGIIATSEIFNEYVPQINAVMKSTGCIAFDMECAGPAQVCYNQKVPFITIKSISDNGDFKMFNALKHISAKNAQILVENMLKSL